MTDIPFRGYITGAGIEDLLPNVPFLEYERNIFNVLLVLTFPGKSPEELIEKCEDFWDLLGEDPGRLLILLRFMCEMQIMNDTTGSNLGEKELNKIINEFEDWRNEMEEQINANKKEEQYFRINEYKYYLQFISAKLKEMHEPDSVQRLRVTMPRNTEIDYNNNNDFSDSIMGILKTDMICHTINWKVLINQFFVNDKGELDRNKIGERRLPFLNINDNGSNFDDLVNNWINSYDGNMFSLFNFECGDNKYVSIDCTYHYLFNFLYDELELLLLQERVCNFENNQGLMICLVEFNSLNSDLNWRPVDLITLFPDIDDPTMFYEALKSKIIEVHRNNIYGDIDDEEAIKNQNNEIEQNLTDLRLQSIEHHMNNLQMVLPKLVPNYDETGNFLDLSEESGPFIEEYRNVNTVKSMINFETIFNYDYNAINNFLVNVEPSIIEIVNHYFNYLNFIADDFIKLDLLYDMEKFAQDPQIINDFLSRFSDLFNEYLKNLEGLQLKTYSNRDWYKEIDKFRKDNNNDFEAITNAMEQHMIKMKFIQDGCIYVGHFLLGEEATSQEILQHLNAQFNFMEKDIDDIYNLVEKNKNVTEKLKEYLDAHPEIKLDYYEKIYTITSIPSYVSGDQINYEVGIPRSIEGAFKNSRIDAEEDAEWSADILNNLHRIYESHGLELDVETQNQLIQQVKNYINDNEAYQELDQYLQSKSPTPESTFRTDVENAVEVAKEKLSQINQKILTEEQKENEGQRLTNQLFDVSNIPDRVIPTQNEEQVSEVPENLSQEQINNIQSLKQQKQDLETSLLKLKSDNVKPIDLIKFNKEYDPNRNSLYNTVIRINPQKWQESKERYANRNQNPQQQGDPTNQSSNELPPIDNATNVDNSVEESNPQQNQEYEDPGEDFIRQNEINEENEQINLEEIENQDEDEKIKALEKEDEEKNNTASVHLPEMSEKPSVDEIQNEIQMKRDSGVIEKQLKDYINDRYDLSYDELIDLISIVRENIDNDDPNPYEEAYRKIDDKIEKLRNEIQNKILNYKNNRYAFSFEELNAFINKVQYNMKFDIENPYEEVYKEIDKIIENQSKQKLKIPSIPKIETFDPSRKTAIVDQERIEKEKIQSNLLQYIGPFKFKDNKVAGFVHRISKADNKDLEYKKVYQKIDDIFKKHIRNHLLAYIDDRIELDSHILENFVNIVLKMRDDDGRFTSGYSYIENLIDQRIEKETKKESEEEPNQSNSVENKEPEEEPNQSNSVENQSFQEANQLINQITNNYKNPTSSFKMHNRPQIKRLLKEYVDKNNYQLSDESIEKCLNKAYEMRGGFGEVLSKAKLLADEAFKNNKNNKNRGKDEDVEEEENIEEENNNEENKQHSGYSREQTIKDLHTVLEKHVTGKNIDPGNINPNDVDQIIDEALAQLKGWGDTKKYAIEKMDELIKNMSEQTNESTVPTTGVKSSLQKAQENLQKIQQNQQQNQQQTDPNQQEENEENQEQTDPNEQALKLIHDYRPNFISKISYSDQIPRFDDELMEDIFQQFTTDINDISEVNIAKEYLDKVIEIDKYRNSYFYIHYNPDYEAQGFSFRHNEPVQNRSIVDRDY